MREGTRATKEQKRVREQNLSKEGGSRCRTNPRRRGWDEGWIRTEASIQKPPKNQEELREGAWKTREQRWLRRSSHLRVKAEEGKLREQDQVKSPWTYTKT